MDRTLRIALACSVSVWTLAPAHAQVTTASGGQDTSSYEGLSEIIVTATRTGETRLQETPIAVTSISGAELATRNIENLQDVAQYVPSLSIGNRAGSGSSFGAVSLRGMGVDAEQSSQAVGTYIDDVFYASNFGNILGLMDVERVEVLRGPQGTLFGRNTIAGAIQYVTKAPGRDLDGYVRGALGNYDRRDIAAAINVPLSDTFAIRVAGQYNSLGGYVHDDLNDIDRGATKTRAARIRARWDPTDRLQIDLKAEYGETETNGRAVLLTRYDNNAQFIGLANAFRDLFFPTLPSFGFTDQNLSPNRDPSNFSNSGFNDLDSSKNDTTVFQASLSYDITDNLRIKSITSHTETNSMVNTDFDATPQPLLGVRQRDKNKAFSQEIQLIGNAIDGRLNYTLGGFYFDSERNYIQTISVGYFPYDPSVGTSVYNTESFAGYGQASFDITDRLSATVGLRYTSDSLRGGVEGAYAEEADGSQTPLTFDSERVTYNDWSPYMGVNFKATDDVFLFAKVSKGFRAGGFTVSRDFLDDPEAGNRLAVPFRPETAWTYEVGVRIEALDGRLRFNPTVFQTEWKNIQFLAPGTVPNIFTANAGDARIRGLELETQFAIVDNLVLSGSFSYLDAKYTRVDENVRVLFPDGFVTNPNFFSGPQPQPPIIPNVNGPNMGAPLVRNYINLDTPLSRAPEFKFTIGARYTAPLSNGAQIVTNVDYAWTDEQKTLAEDIAPLSPSYGLLNGRIQYNAPNDRWSIGIFGNNLTNEFYTLNETAYDLGRTVGMRLEDPGRPRTYGVELSFNF
jgi:Outer membrane receptor proteins, mostly Fe transport